MRIVRTVAALRETVAAWKRNGERVAVVPTMGALHAAHMSLVRAARTHGDRTIVTIFVNPTQFNDPTDLANYPRTEAADEALLRAETVDLVFAPSAEEMYPRGFATTVSVAGVSDDLEGAFRPGHFAGVATVVAKLLAQTQADAALFGEKDFQQLLVIRRMARDLDIPVTIVGCPTVRESDGLALSSRNARLSPQDRKVAPRLSAALFSAAREISEGGDAAKAIAAARETVLASGFAKIDYIELRSEADLRPLERASEPARLLAAAFLGKVRLIDNVPVAPSS
jgi:pantoate--beta-alanine ligase